MLEVIFVLSSMIMICNTVSRLISGFTCYVSGGMLDLTSPPILRSRLLDIKLVAEDSCSGSFLVKVSGR